VNIPERKLSLDSGKKVLDCFIHIARCPKNIGWIPTLYTKELSNTTLVPFGRILYLSAFKSVTIFAFALSSILFLGVGALLVCHAEKGTIPAS
jgi:hypothetical protein